MTVRAKFKCTSVTVSEGWNKDENGNKKNIKSVKLQPVYGNGDPNHENTKFWEATPSGAIELGTVNEAAAAQFEIGKEYYVDFSPAE